MSNAKKFPYWFFLGILLNNSSWIVSWLHIPIVSDYTFFPLWLGFALFLDGLNYYQKGSSMLSRDPIAYLCLFLLSSTFWFYFEGIVFVTQNWYYISTTRFSTFSYQLIASLSFSTILPAILELIELVWTDKVKNKTIKIIQLPKKTYSMFILLGIISLFLPFINAAYFFPTIWLAPFLLLEGINYRLKNDSLIADIVDRNNWTRIIAIGGVIIISGLFWEMWNFFATTKWIYEVPIVGFFKIFEMPILGFAGYIPFGWTIFALYSFIQGVFAYPKKDFLPIGIWKETGIIRVKSKLIILILCVILSFITTLGNYFTEDYFFNKNINKNIVFENKTGTTEFKGTLLYCKYSFVQGTCLLDSNNMAYWLTDSKGNALILEIDLKVTVTGIKETKDVGMDEIKVSSVIGL